MRNLIALFFSLCVLLSFSGNAIAQEKAKTQVSSVKQKGETVRFTLVSSRPFIFGNNRYLLYIGGKEFKRNEQWKKSGKGYLSFFIPESDFGKLVEGSDIYLTYGSVNIEEADMEELAAKSRKCWSLGKFSKSMLTK